MATPLNDVERLKRWVALRVDGVVGTESVVRPSTSYELLAESLERARNDIDVMTSYADITSLPDARQGQIRDAELYLALAYIVEEFGQRWGFLDPGGEQQAVGGVMATPKSPTVLGEKGRADFWMGHVAEMWRARAAKILKGSMWSVRMSAPSVDTTLDPLEYVPRLSRDG